MTDEIICIGCGQAVNRTLENEVPSRWLRWEEDRGVCGACDEYAPYWDKGGRAFQPDEVIPDRSKRALLHDAPLFRFDSLDGLTLAGLTIDAQWGPRTIAFIERVGQVVGKGVSLSCHCLSCHPYPIGAGQCIALDVAGADANFSVTMCVSGYREIPKPDEVRRNSDIDFSVVHNRDAMCLAALLACRLEVQVNVSLSEVARPADVRRLA